MCRRCHQYTTILQTVLIVLGWVCVFGYLIQDSLRKTVVSRFKEVVDTQTKDEPGELNQLGVELYEATDAMAFFTGYFQFLIAEYHLVLLFSFFTNFRAQPRLGIVTGTLESSILDIVHFLLVLVPTFMAYAISGCFIFGRRMAEFSTITSAMGTCVRMLMEGEYDWPALSEEHPMTAGIWVWSFMLLLVLLMLNMVLAIILDEYTEIRRHSGKSETVWRTMRRLMDLLWYWKVWVSSQALRDRLQGMGRLISREDLLREFPHMCRPQLEGLFQDCEAMADALSGKLTDVAKMQMTIFLGIERISKEVASLYGPLAHAEDPQDASFEVAAAGRGWLQEISERMALQNHRMLNVQWQLQQLQWQWMAVEAVCGNNTESSWKVKADAEWEATQAKDDNVL